MWKTIRLGTVLFRNWNSFWNQLTKYFKTKERKNEMKWNKVIDMSKIAWKPKLVITCLYFSKRAHTKRWGETEEKRCRKWKDKQNDKRETEQMKTKRERKRAIERVKSSFITRACACVCMRMCEHMLTLSEHRLSRRRL